MGLRARIISVAVATMRIKLLASKPRKSRIRSTFADALRAHKNLFSLISSGVLPLINSP